jgi:hypothetical protein
MKRKQIKTDAIAIENSKAIGRLSRQMEELKKMSELHALKNNKQEISFDAAALRAEFEQSEPPKKSVKKSVSPEDGISTQL